MIAGLVKLAVLGRLAARAADWLLHRPGYMFLTAADDELARQEPGRFRYAWLELLILSVAWSLASVGIWAGALVVFGAPVGRAMPAGLLAAVFVLWPYRRAVTGGLELLFASNATLRSLAGTILVIVLMLAFLSLKLDWRKDPALPQWLMWIRPWEKVYRPLVLMPLWGAWAMFITPQFCRPGAGTEPATAVWAKGCSPISAAAVMGLLLALTVTYYNFLGWWQLPIAGTAIVSAIAAGLVSCKLAGGLTRRALLTANVLTQLAFLLASLATCNMVYW